MQSKGFTLIEVLITVAIVAILAAIAVPSYASYVKRSKANSATADLGALALTLESGFQKTLAYPTYAAGTVIPNLPSARTSPQTTDFGAWSPSQGQVFSYSITSDSATSTYTVTATGTGSLAGCTLSLSNANVRTVNSASACGFSSW